MDTTQTADATLVSQLNDLLQLDHDAVAAYSIAIRELDSPRLRSELQAHMDDHQRHIEELERHIKRLDGMTLPLPHLSGIFKLAVQSAVAAGGDRAVLLAFKANEMQVRQVRPRRDRNGPAGRHTGHSQPRCCRRAPPLRLGSPLARAARR
jgi:hypothetical protein